MVMHIFNTSSSGSRKRKFVSLRPGWAKLEASNLKNKIKQSDVCAKSLVKSNKNNNDSNINNSTSNNNNNTLEKYCICIIM